MSKIDTYHVPIMLNEVLELLAPGRGGVFVDGTLGGGSHASETLKHLPEGSHLYGIDRDSEAIAEATSKLTQANAKADFTVIRGNFFDAVSLLKERGVKGIDGCLLDLGVSSHQLDEPMRGFSYHESAPLDMRMDDRAPLRAYDVVNTYAWEDLARIIREYGEERFAAKVASAIVREREKAPIETTTELADIIKSAIPAASRRDGPHPARRTFQAIRIEVNGELAGLYEALEEIAGFLNPGGRLLVITFHSLEDRIVKNLFRKLNDPCICDKRAPICVCGKVKSADILTRKPVVAGEEELGDNTRARSAKLRAIRSVALGMGQEGDE